MERDYTRLEHELKNATNLFAKVQIAPHKPAELKIAQNRLLATVQKLNIPSIEKRYPKKFLFWLLEKYMHFPTSKHLENLGCLLLIDYPLMQKDSIGQSLINYYTKHPESIKLLEFYFENCSKHIIEFNDPFHPLLIADLNDELFRFLVIRFEKYNRSNLTPLNFAIAKGNKLLATRILENFPEMLHAFSPMGINALSHAIFSESTEMLDFILTFNPPIDFKNSDGNCLAHLVFCLVNQDFLKTIIFDPKYASLNLQTQILSQNLRNAHEQLPIFCALNQSHYEIFEHILTCAPSLKHEFPHICLGLIQNQDCQSLDYLYSQHHFEPNITIEFFSRFIRLTFSSGNYHILRWLCQLASLDINNKKAFNLILAIVDKNIAKMLELLADEEIAWDSLLPIIPWKVTELLIESDHGNLIAEFNLFERSDFFMVQARDDLKENFLNCILRLHQSSLENKISPKYKSLITYFCNYLNRHQAKYPEWVKAFGDPIFFINTFLHNYQIEVHNQPLLHYFESYIFCTKDRIEVIKKKLVNPNQEAILDGLFQFYQTQISQFMSVAQVDINIKDKEGFHLFAKLIKSNQLIRISYLKEQFPQVTLENLDPIGSNLLHLACQNNYIETVKWCIKEKIDPNQIRHFDNRLAIEIAFENFHMDIVNHLKKLVKPSTFMNVLTQLIRNGNNALIHYLIEHGFFGFKLTPHHISLLESLSHPIINLFLRRHNEEKTAAVATAEVTSKPELKEESLLGQVVVAPQKAVLLNQVALNAYRFLLQKTSLDNLNNTTKILKQDIYHEPLRVIFGDNILAYALKIISSENPGLIKQFFRIPIVNELMNSNENWYKLVQKISLTIKPYTLAIICEQEIAKIQINRHIPSLILADIASKEMFKFYSTNFELTLETIKSLMSTALDSGNTAILRALLTTSYAEHILLTNPLSMLMSSFDHPYEFSQLLLTQPFLSGYLASEDNILLKHAIYLNQPAIVKNLLIHDEVRQQLLKTGFCVIQEIIDTYQEEMIPLFSHYQDLEILLSQFPSIKPLLHDAGSESHAMKFYIPRVVHVEELFEAISNADLELLIELCSSIAMTPQFFSTLMHHSVSSRNIDALMFLATSHTIYFKKQFKLIKSLLHMAILQNDNEIFRCIVNFCESKDLNVILNIKVLESALLNDNMVILSYMLQFPFIQKQAHKFNQSLLIRSIAHQDIKLIDFLLKLPNVKNHLLGNCEALIGEALKQDDPEVLFHLLLNNIIFVNSIRNPQLTPDHLMHFTAFYIQSFKHKYFMPQDQLQTIELMKSTEILACFHNDLRKLKQQFFLEKKDAEKQEHHPDMKFLRK